jgi:hypothetical protein
MFYFAGFKETCMRMQASLVRAWSGTYVSLAALPMGMKSEARAKERGPILRLHFGPCNFFALAAILGALWLHGAKPARGAEPEGETRNFTITIDSKPAGSYQMQIRTNPDGTRTMTGTAIVKLTNFVLFNYRYSYAGTETWDNVGLVQLKSSSDDDGKKFNVAAGRDANAGALVVWANSAKHVLPTDVWTTTYWHLPDPRFRGQKIRLLDADTGKYMEGVLQAVGVVQMNVLNHVENCTQYRLTGGERGELDVELWYDAHERLVREVSKEGSHRYILTLASVSR